MDQEILPDIDVLGLFWMCCDGAMRPYVPRGLTTQHVSHGMCPRFKRSKNKGNLRHPTTELQPVAESCHNWRDKSINPPLLNTGEVIAI